MGNKSTIYMSIILVVLSLPSVTFTTPYLVTIKRYLISSTPLITKQSYHADNPWLTSNPLKPIAGTSCTSRSVPPHLWQMTS